MLTITVLAGPAIAAAMLVAYDHRRRAIEARRIRGAVLGEVTALQMQAAACAAEAGRRKLSGEAFDAAFFDRYRLSPPLLYPALATGIAVLTPDSVARIAYFHAKLASARERFADWRDGPDASGPMPYLVFEALIRAVNHVQVAIDDLVRTLGYPRRKRPEMSPADLMLDRIEQDDPGLCLPPHWPL